jgi:hypothetical protein
MSRLDKTIFGIFQIDFPKNLMSVFNFCGTCGNFLEILLSQIRQILWNRLGESKLWSQSSPSSNIEKLCINRTWKCNRKIKVRMQIKFNYTWIKLWLFTLIKFCVLAKWTRRVFSSMFFKRKIQELYN